MPSLGVGEGEKDEGVIYNDCCCVSLLLQFQLFYSFVVVQIIVVVLWWQKYTGPNWLHV